MVKKKKSHQDLSAQLPDTSSSKHEIDGIFEELERIAPVGSASCSQEKVTSKASAAESRAGPAQKGKKNRLKDTSEDKVGDRAGTVQSEGAAVIKLTSKRPRRSDPGPVALSGPLGDGGFGTVGSAKSDREGRGRPEGGKQEARPKKFVEGLPVYLDEDLGLSEAKRGKAGRTKDCPFDCWCCF